jgi:hypothetical protein
MHLGTTHDAFQKLMSIETNMPGSTSVTLGGNSQMTSGSTNSVTADERSSMPNATPTEVVVDEDAEEEPAEAAMEVVGAVAADADGIIEAAEVIIPIPQTAIMPKAMQTTLIET